MSLFDNIPDDVPDKAIPATIFDKANREYGHLLITTGAPRTGQDWMFLNRGGGTIECCLPGWDTAVELDPDQLRVLGCYCLDIADRIERQA
jgi:hypothetical protein